MKTWLEDIEDSLRDLGGISHYSELYKRIKEVRQQPLPKSWHAIIRRTIETNSSDSDAFNGKDIFYSTHGIGKGIWGLRDHIPTIKNIDLTEDDLAFPEGRQFLKMHLLRERNPKLIIEAKRKFKEQKGRLFCEVCDFCFEDKYGEIGVDFIEAHHIKPISFMQECEFTNIADLIMVCSNCHKMLHRKRPWITKENLKLILTK